MKKDRFYFRLIGIYLAAAMFVLGSFPADLFAGWIPSRVLVETSTPERSADLERIRAILETKIVSERMNTLGFTHAEINSRLSQLDDETLHEVAANVDMLQKGGDGVLGGVIALLVIAILVVILLKLTGRRIVIE